MGLMTEPTASGRFGEFGGRYVPEALVPACAELEAAFRAAWADPSFHAERDALLRDYAGRPTPVTECHRLSDRLGVRVGGQHADLEELGVARSRRRRGARRTRGFPLEQPAVLGTGDRR